MSTRNRFSRSRGPARSQQRGMTVVELLTVISIIGMLMALLLPAIQMARESGRRNTCRNNLRQIGIALLGHESAQRRLPSNGWGYQWYGDPDRGTGLNQPGGWAYCILPYLERRDLAKMGSGLSGQARLQALAAANQSPLPVFHCPSRRRADLYPFDLTYPPMNTAPVGSVAKADYAVNGGDLQLSVGGGPSSYTQADDPAYPWPDSSKATGVSNFHSVIHLAGITDGMSATYLVGEKNVSTSGSDPGDDQTLFVGYDLDNTRWTTVSWPPVPDRSAPAPESFGSSHIGVCHFVFCDGRVVDISYFIDPEIHRRLGNRKDGELIDDRALHLD
ncbi:MAG: DUF1559 domain-containing protein [Pirellulales bacterium]